MQGFHLRLQGAMLLFGILTLAACRADSDSSNHAEDVATLEEMMAASVVNWNTANIDGLMEDTADEFVMMGPGVPAQTGKATLRAAWIDYLAGHEDVWNPVVDDIQVSGDMAFIRSSFTTTATALEDGLQRITRGKTIVILKRESDGVWRHSVEIWNRDTPDE